MSTFIVVSPDFPQININVCENLAGAGVRVLGIGDADYGGLDRRLKESMFEYFKVGSLDNYSEVYRAVAFFAHKYGKPTHLDSNNSHWLNQDAQLRRDFNIPGVTKNASDSQTLAVAADMGLNVGDPTGQIFSWDAIIGDDQEVLFEGVTAWPSQPATEYAYRTVHPAPERVTEIGRKAAEALNARLTFLHVQVAFPPSEPPRIIRISRSAPPAFTLDMHNFAHDINTYAIFSGEVARIDELLSTQAQQRMPSGRIAVYVSRQDEVSYRYNAHELQERWTDSMRIVARNPIQYQRGMGDTYYIAVVDDDAEADCFTTEVTERE